MGLRWQRRPSPVELAQQALDTASMTLSANASSTAAEALGRIDNHEAVCLQRWSKLQNEIRAGLIATIALLFGIIGFLLSHGVPWQPQAAPPAAVSGGWGDRR